MHQLKRLTKQHGLQKAFSHFVCLANCFGNFAEAKTCLSNSQEIEIFVEEILLAHKKLKKAGRCERLRARREAKMATN
jgi:hypothetical protein